MRKALITTALLSLTLGTLAFAPSSAAADYSTTNIGSKEWWDENAPYRAAKTKRVKGKKVNYCPKGSSIEIAGARVQSSGNGATITFDPRDTPKKVTLPWVNGKNKKVRSGSLVCKKQVEPLQPTSLAELASWTFASGEDKWRDVRVNQPPLETCTPAILPSNVTPQLLSVDLIEVGKPMVYEYQGTVSTFRIKSGPSHGGFYNIQWLLEGGQGNYRYPTWTPNKDGIPSETWETMRLNPEGTTAVNATLPLVPEFGGAARQKSGVSLGGVTPWCGEDLLPDGQDFWKLQYPQTSLTVEGRLNAGGFISDIELWTTCSHVPADSRPNWCA